MTEQSPLSRERIEKGLEKAIFEQSKLTDQYRKDLDAAAVAEAEFKKKFAQARILARTSGEIDGVKVTSDFADDVATNRTHEERLTMLTTSAQEAATRQALLSVRTRIQALQTLNANHREIS